MIQCQRLFPLAVLVTSCFISFLLADKVGASSANSEGGESSKQQRDLPQQQQKHELNLAAAGASHNTYESLLNDDELSSDLTVDARSIPRFVGKKNSVWMDRLSRGVPRFVGKKRASEEVNSGDAQAEDHRLEKRAAPSYVDKREYTYSPRTRGAPYFIGKRYLHYRTSSNTPSSPYLSAQEFKGTFRRSDPYFMGKRTATFEDIEDGNAKFGESNIPSYLNVDLINPGKRGPPRFVGKRGPPRFVGKRGPPRFVGKRGPYFIGKSDIDDKADDYANLEERDLPMFVDLRSAPRFVGKRGPPRFVGKRGAPRFVGKRGAPRFVGKRGPPRFVGKREDEESDEMYDPRESFDLSSSDLSEHALPSLLELVQQREAEDDALARRREAAELIMSKLQSAEDVIQEERPALESHTDESASGETGSRR